MSESLSLYRRHRPGSFDEVVGQPHIVRTLRNAVEQGKVNHAYLFVGSRGTGKTSMAKILARSLNCERGGPTVTPCGECESCRTVAAGTSVDVIEMDAASNRSVDDIRDLRERVAYAPAGGGWKVYILDEAHMLTKEAWNAFLKTLEEPPPNTVFVLATTEAHKVMPTIADRCQRFDFKRPSLEQIAEVLARVAAAEEIEIDQPAISMVARSASGSFRDALGTLDQLVAFKGARLELADVLEVLGAVDTELLLDVIDAIAAEDGAAVLGAVERLVQSGREVTQFARDLLDTLRALVVLQTAGRLPESLPVADEDAERMRSRAGSLGAANLFRTIDEMAAALESIRAGDDPRMAVEMALVKAARPDFDPSVQGIARRLERLERKIAGSPTQPPAGDGGRGAGPGGRAVDEAAAAPSAEAPGGSAPTDFGGAATGAGQSEAVQPEASADAPATEPTEPESGSAPPTEPGALTLEEARRAWPAVIEQLRTDGKELLAALFDGARPVDLDLSSGSIAIGFPKSGSFNKRQAEEGERRKDLATALELTFGEGLEPTFSLIEAEGEIEPAGERREIDEDELVDRLKSEFNAEEVN